MTCVGHEVTLHNATANFCAFDDISKDKGDNNSDNTNNNDSNHNNDNIPIITIIMIMC